MVSSVLCETIWKMQKLLLLSFLMFLILPFIFSQSSYFKIIEDQSPFTPVHMLSHLNAIAVNNIGDLFYMIGDGDSVIKLAKLAQDGELLTQVRINAATEEEDGYWYPAIHTFQAKDNWNGITAIDFPPGSGSAIFVVNAVSGIAWSKKISLTSPSSASILFTESPKVYCSMYPFNGGTSPRYSGVVRFDRQTGNQEWGYFYEKVVDLDQQTTFINGLKEKPNTNISALMLRRFNGALTTHTSLLEIDTNGYLVNNIDIITDSLDVFSHTIDSQSNIFLTGKKIGLPGTASESDNTGFIIKLDANYNLLWAKKLVAENFNCRKLKLELTSDENLIFSYSTFGLLPVITGGISSEGELLWHKGYAFGGAETTISPNGSIYLTSVFLYNEDNTYERANVIAKTTPSGEIEGCPQFAACLRLEDFEIELEESAWERTDAPDLPSIDVSLEPIAFSFYDTCGVPAYPQPIFHLPDTTCQYTCIMPDSLKNALANHTEWTITGPGIDTTITDLSFEWCFDSVGLYTVEQEIWLLGCSGFYSKTITVLSDDLSLSLGDDQYICKDEAYQIHPSAQRSLTSFLWSDGSETNTISVLLPGEYSLTATDGYCVDSTAINLALIEDWLEVDPLSVPADTVLCPDLLPYILQPVSPYATTFYLDEEVTQNSTFQLSKEGLYTINTTIENCIFSKSFELTLENCQVPIYFPNAFSPNNDGINDQVFPQGQDFDGLHLQVFNRWGDLVFETSQSPFAWNGQFDDRTLSPGVYVLSFSYFNHRNLKKEVINVDILLLQ